MVEKKLNKIPERSDDKVGNELKILVVDDTVTDRKILTTVLSGFPDVELLGTAPNGKIALSKIALNRPDLLLVDLVMPEMDGIETLQCVKEKYPDIDVVIISAIDSQQAQITVQALQFGALDFVPKPRNASASENMAELKSVLARLISIAQTRKYSRRIRNYTEYRKSSPRIPRPLPEAPTPPPEIKYRKAVPHKPTQQNPIPQKIEAVCIGVSTGGPNALQEIIPKLDADLPVPVFIVQHMPPMFTASLAARLDNESGIRVVEGRDGMYVEKGVGYIAPGGKHMVVRADRYKGKMIGLLDSPPVNSCRPSVDVLFRSVCMAYGGRTLAVILTGMGNDGVEGVIAIRRKGGYSLIQDEKTAVVWGMPGSVSEAGQADEILPLDRLAERIKAVVKGENR